MGDLLFGLVLPWVCIALDRTVVADVMGEFSGGLPVTPYVALLTLTGQAALVVWLAFRELLGWWLVPLSGVLVVGACWAAVMTAVGVLGGGLLLLSGLAIGPRPLIVGAMGLLTPLTIRTFVRAGARAAVAARPYAHRESRVAILLLAGLLTLSACYVTGRAVKAVAAGAERLAVEGTSPDDRARAARRLRALWLFPGVRPWRLWDTARRGDRPPGHTERAREALTMVHAVPRDEIDRRLPGWD